MHGAVQHMLPTANAGARWLCRIAPQCCAIAGAESPTGLRGDLEILTLAGSVSPDGARVHGRTTGELSIALLPGHRFAREFDPGTGFMERVIRSEPVVNPT
ncbi:DUF296 domain-containing protein [Burkholderia sp. Bp8963]|uniref:DUF296 domain-containing protein n=1 Tax=Burkholderia sp. Bp8963 TaxID=2184547 RepID=UPI0039081E78